MPKRTLYLLTCCAVVIALASLFSRQVGKKVLGATANVVVGSSPGIEFYARVDTGASITSLDVGSEGIVIEDGVETPEENIGKPVRIRVCNRNDDEQWIEAKIEGVILIRTAHGVGPRYQVTLPITCQGVSKEIAITLNDRGEMRHALLLGRDFLSGDFVVDVTIDDTNLF